MTTTSNIVPAKPAAVNGTPLTPEGYLPAGHPAYVALAAYLDELAAQDRATLDEWSAQPAPVPPPPAEVLAASEREEARADRYEARLATDPALRAEVRERGRRLDGIAREARKRRPVRVGRRQPQGVA